MTQRTAVLFANEAFYSAFAMRDLDAMEELWSRESPVTIIHPGWKLVTGREGVMRSWSSILANPEIPQITCHNPEVVEIGDVAYVICYEEIGGAVLSATNVFRREGQEWKLVHHQAGPCNEPPALEDDSDEDRPRLQ